jgi:hypothetical protein
MKRLLLVASLFIVTQGHAQTYQKIETTHFDRNRNITSKLTKYKSGSIKIASNYILVDDKQYSIGSRGKMEAEDELYTSQEYICITESKNGALRALKVVLFFTPKKELCDLIVKSGNSNIDYCITDK